MARYLTVNSKFRPFSYDELLKAPMMATEYHNKLDDELIQYDSKGAGIRAYFDDATDSRYINQYDKWRDSVSGISSELSSNGIGGIDRGRLLQVKRDYNDLTKLMPAIEKREKQREMYQTMTANDPSLQMRINPNTLGLDSYMGKSPVLSGVSGNAIAADTQAIAAALSSQTYSNTSALDENTDKQYYKIMEAQGFTRAQAEKFLESKNAEDIIKEVITVRGGDDLLPTQHDILMEYGRLGFRKGLTGKFDAKYIANQGWKLDNTLSSPPTFSFNALNPRRVYTPKEKQDIEKLAPYFKEASDGSMTVDIEAIRAKFKTDQIINTVGGTPFSYHSSPTSLGYSTSPNYGFRDPLIIMLKEHGLKDDGSNLEQVVTDFFNNNKVNISDATQFTDFQYHVDTSKGTQSNIKEMIISAATSGKLKEAQFNSETKKYEPSSNSIPAVNIREDSNIISGINYGPYGITVTINTQKGKKEYMLPRSINEVAFDYIIEQSKLARSLGESYYKNGYYGEEKDSEGNNIFVQFSPEARNKAYIDYVNSLNNAHNGVGQIFGINTTKDQQIDQIPFLS